MMGINPLVVAGGRFLCPQNSLFTAKDITSDKKSSDLISVLRPTVTEVEASTVGSLVEKIQAFLSKPLVCRCENQAKFVLIFFKTNELAWPGPIKQKSAGRV